MKRSLSVAPSTSTSPVVVAKRAFSDGDAPTQDDETIDLVYPFDWPSATEGNDTGNGGTGGDTGGSGGGSGGTVSVPIDPNGPIIMTNNGLNLKTQIPIAIQSRSVALSSDPNLFSINSSNQLSIKLSPPMQYSNGGIAIAYDTDSLNTNSSNQLSLNFSSTGCIFSNYDGIQLNYDSSTFKSENSALKIKIDPSTCIIVDNGGLSINVDDSAFEISQNKLYLKANPTYLSPYTICTMGDPKFQTGGVNYCASDRGNKWNCKMYVYMVYSAGIVNGLVNTFINSDNTDRSSSSSSYVLNFTSIISTSDNPYINISGFTIRTISPSSGNYNLFTPSVTSNEGFNMIEAPAPSSPSAKWYIPPSNSGFKSSYFSPIPNGTKFNESNMSYGIASIKQSDGQINYALALTYNMSVASNSYWYNSGANLTTGSIPFTYQGQLPNGVQTTP